MRELSKRAQGRIVLLSLVLVATMAVVAPGIVKPEPAEAVGDCGVAWTWNLRGESVTHCWSSVPLRLHIPRNGNNTRARVENIRNQQGNITMTYADGTTSSDLAYISFGNFRIDQAATLTTVGGDGYQLSFTPDNTMVFGGPGVNSDLIVERSSTIRVDTGWLDFLGLQCAIAGGSGGRYCQLTIAQFVAWSALLNGSNYNILEMDLRIHAAVIYREGGGQTTGSIQMPNTTVQVN